MICPARTRRGLGYRIFLVRRYLAMDIILPYVLWITLLGFAIDWLLRHLMRWFYPGTLSLEATEGAFPIY
ncbi:MAG: hypothetical protein SD837_13850 [Candidatus Electrothrix scaldis]|nr:MAG: hypothetical protein SD837_13850 [Candidatus Electrothrix sp. GW3-3]